MTLGLNTTLSPFLTPLTQNVWDQQPLEAEWFPQLWLGYQGQPPSVHGKRACAASYLWDEGVTEKSHTILKHRTSMSTTKHQPGFDNVRVE